MGQIGSVYKQPEKEEDDSCHSWRVPSVWEGVQRGVKERRQGEQKGNWEDGIRNHAMYICNYNVCVKNN